MKKYFLFCFIIIGASAAFSQDNVSLQYVPTFATFKYTDSKGDADPGMHSAFRSSFGLSYTKVFRSGLFIRPEAGVKNLGAMSDLYTQKLDWSLHYFDFNFGLGFIKRFGPVAPFIGFAPYVSRLYKATQALGTDEYDLMDGNLIKTGDYGINIFGGLKFQLSEPISLFAEARNSTGLMQLEPNTSGKSQKLYNRATSFHLGISFNIVSKRRAKMRSNF